MYKFWIYINGELNQVRDYGHCTKRHMAKIVNNIIRYADKVEVKDEFNRVVMVVRY